MAESLTFKQLAEIVIEQLKRPLSSSEIWEEALKLGLSKKVNTKGKTPWQTIGAILYTDIKDNPKTTPFTQNSKRPATFSLKKLSGQQVQPPPEKPIAATFVERDLYPLIARFVYSYPHFRAQVKTIHHESSTGGRRGYNEWLHPDLVGVYLPFDDYDEVTLRLQKSLSLSSVKLFSFEVKRELSFANLRQSYFQAVSNSSWAYEGYLVVAEMRDESNLKDEIQRLNHAFGIGLIRLNPESIDESEIVFQAHQNPDLDWSTIDRLVEENPEFKQFIVDVEEDLQLRKVKGHYDKRLNEKELAEYISTKKIGKRG
jgi:hypothetical protein